MSLLRTDKRRHPDLLDTRRQLRVRFYECAISHTQELDIGNCYPGRRLQVVCLHAECRLMADVEFRAADTTQAEELSLKLQWFFSWCSAFATQVCHLHADKQHRRPSTNNNSRGSNDGRPRRGGRKRQRFDWLAGEFTWRTHESLDASPR